MGRDQGIRVFTEFINDNTVLKDIEVHFNGKKYKAENLTVEVLKEIPVYAVGESLTTTLLPQAGKVFLIVEDQLVEDFWHYRADHGSEYPVVDIVLTTASDKRVFLKEATVVEWFYNNICILVDKIKFLLDDVYELATDPIVQKGFIEHKKITDSTFRRFHQILFDEE